MRRANLKESNMFHYFNNFGRWRIELIHDWIICEKIKFLTETPSYDNMPSRRIFLIQPLFDVRRYLLNEYYLYVISDNESYCECDMTSKVWRSHVQNSLRTLSMVNCFIASRMISRTAETRGSCEHWNHYTRNIRQNNRKSAIKNWF